jgi:transcriptional regulator with XRE-family HTH domain
VTFEALFDDDVATDRRGAARRTLRLPVDGRFPAGGESVVTVRDISATGMLIETGVDLVEGDTFAVDLPEVGEQSAQVVWANAPMFGCRLSATLGAAALSAAQLRGDAFATPLPESPGDFGARLHRLRVERGMSLADIANRLGVSKPTVWAWEHGKSRPVEKRLSALAEALGVTPAGLEPAVSGPPEELEKSRLRIAQAYGVEPMRVRIMIEL